MTGPGASGSDSPEAAVMPGEGYFCRLYINSLEQLGPPKVVKISSEIFHPLRGTRAEFLKVGPIESNDYSMLMDFTQAAEYIWKESLIC